MRYVLVFISCLIAGCLGSFPNKGKSERPSPPPSEVRLAGGCIFPADPNENIRLDLTQVTIRLKREYYSVDTVFHLFNTGESSDLMVGVPKYGILEYRDDNPQFSDFLRFEAWVDGRKEEFAEVRNFMRHPDALPISSPLTLHGTAETRWMAKKIAFQTKTPTVIRVRYEALYHIVTFPDPRIFGCYLYSMGKYWKNTIRKSVFVVDGTDVAEEGWVGHAAIGVKIRPRGLCAFVICRGI